VAIFLTCMSVRVCRPKLLKNLCLSLVSGVPHFFRTTPLPMLLLSKRRGVKSVLPYVESPFLVVYPCPQNRKYTYCIRSADRRRTEPRPYVDKIQRRLGHLVPEICSNTQTDRHVRHNTLLPCWGRSNKRFRPITALDDYYGYCGGPTYTRCIIVYH